MQNIILLSMDALRADHLSCYGYHRETSPVLDELAAESLQFLNAYSASSHTREAVPALLTGEYPDIAIGPEYHLRKDTIATTLSEEGFATGGFHSNPYISRAYGYDRGFDEFNDDLHLGQHKFIALAQRALDKFRNRHYARAETINERSLKWIDSLDEDKPFFLWNHYMDTHGPYEPPEPYATQFRDDPVTDDRAQSLYNRAVSDPDSISDEERALLIDLYDAEIRYNDAQIGSFLEALGERGLLEDSLLIVTADHGDAFGEHGYYTHPRELHEELIQVPLALSSPGDNRDDSFSTPVSTLDIVPTILDFCGVQTAKLVGRRLLPEPETPVSNKTGVVYAVATGEDDHEGTRRFAARGSRWKGILTRDIASGEVLHKQLFDLETDPDEKVPLTERTAKREAILQDLQEFSSCRLKPINGNTTTDHPDEATNEVNERLEALGYK